MPLKGCLTLLLVIRKVIWGGRSGRQEEFGVEEMTENAINARKNAKIRCGVISVILEEKVNIPISLSLCSTHILKFPGQHLS